MLYKSRTRSLLFLLAFAAFFSLSAQTARAGARIVVINSDSPNEGFNDQTSAQPVGGNGGTTVGQQRLIAFQFAAEIWGATLDSNVEIRIRANFDPLTCTATGGTLGSAGPLGLHSDFDGTEYGRTLYVPALANKRAGRDLNATRDDIRARFNSDIGKSTCLSGASWYYGLDTNQAPNQINLVVVTLHEFAHGLGFISIVDEETGANGSDEQGSIIDDVFSHFLFDTVTGKRWTEMTDAERKASAINAGRVVWIGENTTAAVPQVLRGTPELIVNTPSSIAGVYTVGTASFGAQISQTTANLVQAFDTGGASQTDGCSSFTNAAAINGNIALVDRGNCNFTVKARNAQDAGAVAVVIVNNVADVLPPGLGGEDALVRIPAVSITQADGNRIRTEINNGAQVSVTLHRNPNKRAGADSQGRALVYTVDPVKPGSSVSHFDESADPNLLMEPNNDSDVTLSVQPPQDLTLPLFRDIGWYEDKNGDNLPDNIDTSPARFSILAKTMTRDCATGDYLVAVTVTNTGTSIANNVRITGATLGAATLSSVTYFNKIAPGATATRTLRFPSSAGAPNSSVRLSINGADSTTFLGNSFSQTPTPTRRNLIRTAKRVLPACRQ